MAPGPVTEAERTSRPVVTVPLTLPRASRQPSTARSRRSGTRGIPEVTASIPLSGRGIPFLCRMTSGWWPSATANRPAPGYGGRSSPAVRTLPRSCSTRQAGRGSPPARQAARRTRSAERGRWRRSGGADSRAGGWWSGTGSNCRPSANGVVLIVVAAQKHGQRGPATSTTTSRDDGGLITSLLPARSVHTPDLRQSVPQRIDGGAVRGTAPVPVPSVARWLLGLGIAATLTANMAQGWSHGPIGAVVAAWPAVSLVGSYELLVWLIRTSGAVERGPSAEHPCNRKACRAAMCPLPIPAADGDRPGGSERHASDPARRPAGQAARPPAIPASEQRDDEVPEQLRQ
jgi:hypothetical protein